MMWPWVSRRALDIARAITDADQSWYSERLKEARAERDEALAKADGLRAKAAGWFPSGDIEARDALKTLGVFVKAGWSIKVEYMPYMGLGPWCCHAIRNKDVSITCYAMSWTEAVGKVAQRVIDRDGTLPEYNPESPKLTSCPNLPGYINLPPGVTLSNEAQIKAPKEPSPCDCDK